MIRTAPAALALSLGLALTGCSSDSPDDSDVAAPPPASASSSAEPSAEQNAEPGTEQPMAAPAAEDGEFVQLAEYEADPASYHEAGDVVLFFNATWCPTCQVSVDSLTTEGVPAGLSVVAVDFDSATELRQQHGVTLQHTYVQIDEAGKQLAKWTGSVSGDDIANQTV